MRVGASYQEYRSSCCECQVRSPPIGRVKEPTYQCQGTIGLVERGFFKVRFASNSCQITDIAAGLLCAKGLNCSRGMSIGVQP
jgi:hypothetical protein